MKTRGSCVLWASFLSCAAQAQDKGSVSRRVDHVDRHDRDTDLDLLARFDSRSCSRSSDLLRLRRLREPCLSLSLSESLSGDQNEHNGFSPTHTMRQPRSIWVTATDDTALFSLTLNGKQCILRAPVAQIEHDKSVRSPRFFARLSVDVDTAPLSPVSAVGAPSAAVVVPITLPFPVAVTIPVTSASRRATCVVMGDATRRRVTLGLVVLTNPPLRTYKSSVFIPEVTVF